MPVLFGIPLIGWIQMLLGTVLVLFVLVKYLLRPKKKKTAGYLIRDVHVIVGDGSELFHQNVLVKDEIIQKISSEPVKDSAVSVIDGSGYTLMPGLIDAHVHIQGGFSCHSEAESDIFLRDRIPQIFSEGVLPYGITTIKDLDAPKHFIYKLRDKLKSGEITGPELLLVGPNFTAPGGHPASTLGSNSPWARAEMAIEVSTPEQVSTGIRELKQAGVDFLKFTYQGGDYWYFDEKQTIRKIDKALMQQIIREGKENGLLATAHAFYYDDVKELLEAGIYGIEHGILDRDIEPDDPIIALWKQSGTRFVPTVNAMTYEKDPSRPQPAQSQSAVRRRHPDRHGHGQHAGEHDWSDRAQGAGLLCGSWAEPHGGHRPRNQKQRRASWGRGSQGSGEGRHGRRPDSSGEGSGREYLQHPVHR